MPKIKLTDAAVERLKAPAGERIDYFDVTLPGFALRVSGPTARTPEGRKSWALFYRYRGVQKRLTLDPVYPALRLADARRRAGYALALLSEGTDPAQARAARKRSAGDSIENVINRFIKQRTARQPRRKKAWSPRYADETKRNFSNHVLPRWRGRLIQEINRRDINELLDAVADEGTAVRDDTGGRYRVPGGPIAANRVLAAIRALFNWALAQGIIEATPAAQIEPRGEETQRDRALTDDDIQFLWPEFKARGYPFGSFFQMALATAQRRDEVAGMRWSEIDEAARLWTIPAERTKAARPHYVPLNAIALEILAESRSAGALIAKARGGKPSEYVFSTTIDVPISGYSRAKAVLDAAVAKQAKAKRRKSVEPWTLHDLRRTAATKLGELGVDRFIISRILNHADRSVTAIYDRHTYLDEKRAALDCWSRRLTSLTLPPRAVEVEAFDPDRISC